MKILFIASRMHSNQTDLLQKLINEKHDVYFFTLGEGDSEDHSIVKPQKIRIYSYIERYLIKNKIDISKYPLYALPNLYFFYKSIFSIRPNSIILRGGIRPLYSLLLFPFMLFYPSKFCFYTQRPCYVLSKNFKQKVLDYLFLDILGIKWYSPVLCRGVFSDNLIKERKIKFIPFFKKNNVTKVVSTKKIKILCVAKYQPRKKIDLIIDSVKLMKSNFELTVIGTASTPERENYYNKLKSSIAERGLEGKVNLLKDIPFSEMGNYYKLNDLFILMSENEVASVTQIEAMSYNLAIICSKDNGSAHYVKDNYNGFVINSNKEELTRALKLYMNDLTLLETHKLNSGKRLIQKFNIEEAYNTFIKFIDTEEK